MIRTIYAIARNTLSETIRQNGFGVLLAFSCFIIAMSPTFAMFTFVDSVKLVQDMGLATILLSGLFLGVLSSTNVINNEIEGRTALTVLSKPVNRTSFVIGKFLGIAASVSIATYIQTVVLLLTYRIGVKDSASVELDYGALAGIIIATIVSIIIAIYYNYFLNRPFMTIAIWSVFFCISGAGLFFILFNKEYKFAPFTDGLNYNLMMASSLTLMAILILVSISVMASTTLKMVANFVVSFLAFFGGLLSEYIINQYAEKFIAVKYIFKAVPDFQIFWITESLTVGKTIPFIYVEHCLIYTIYYIGAILLFGILFFSRKEVTG